MISDISLMKIQVGTLFVQDHDERIRYRRYIFQYRNHFVAKSVTRVVQSSW